MVMVYYSAEMQTEVSEGKAHRRSPGKTKDELLVVLSQCKVLTSPSTDAASQGSSPCRVFIRG